MIRVCPERDGVCPHGDACSHSIDRYRCNIEASREELRAARERPSTTMPNGSPPLKLTSLVRYLVAYWKWWSEPFPALDPKQRPTLPRGALRRQTLRLLNERHKAREPKLEDF